MTPCGFKARCGDATASQSKAAESVAKAKAMPPGRPLCSAVLDARHVGHEIYLPGCRGVDNMGIAPASTQQGLKRMHRGHVHFARAGNDAMRVQGSMLQARRFAEQGRRERS
eukprot:CAMPEP_0115688572 /NCGR_PEP_ID=MMETSP0272-20121206/61088_1 /TAXON_ID=71861 /ORGANISM="Scrippsiella trochoidea, Strain CCMP3099" /LENGTH=111 /DNA_ID=CAMNT_0003128281 /DNA_START=464 /DNA_END=800 /DNA_ORIENTATION=-